MHGPSNPSPPNPVPNPGFTINIGTSAETKDSGSERIAQAHSSAYMPTVATRNGELIQPAFDTKQLLTVLDDTGHSTTMHGPNHFLTDVDEMSHDFYSSHPSIVDIIDFPAGTPLVGPLYHNELWPFDNTNWYFQGDGVDEFFVPTRLEFLALNHAFWHGSFKYTFRYFGPSQSTVRVAAMLVYGSLDIDPETLTLAEAEQYPTIFYTFDSSNREFHVTAQDVNPYRWKMRPDLLANNPNVIDNHKYSQSSNGRIVLFQVTAVSGISIPLSRAPYLYVIKSGNPDFSVYKFQPPPGLTEFQNNPNPISAFEKIEGKDVRVAIPHSAIEPANLPSEETRIEAPPIVENAGTAVENVQTNVLATVRAPPGQSRKLPNSTVSKIELQQVSSKYFQVATLNVGPGESVLMTTLRHPMDTLKAQPLLASKMGRYFRGDLRLLFTVTTGAYSGGNAIAFYIPYGTPGLNIPTTPTKEWVTSFPYAIIDFASNKPIEMFIPYSYYVDYFDMDDMSFINQGMIYIFQQSYISPTTNALPVMLNIQARWENFECSIPRPIPSCVAAGMNTRIAKVEKLPKIGFRKTEPRVSSPHSIRVSTAHATGSKDGSVVNSNNLTTTSTSVTSDEMRRQPGTAPLNNKPIPKSGNGSFASQLNRPYPWFAASLTLASGDRKLYYLPCYPNTYPPNNSTSIGDGENGFPDTISRHFAAFAGDTVYDIIIRSDSEVALFVASFVSSVFDPDHIDDMVAELPLFFKLDDNYPSRVGSAPVVDSYTVNSMLPFTSCITSGKVKVVIPQYNMTRYLPANNSTPLPIINLSHGILALENVKGGPLPANIKIEIYRSLEKGARYAQFSGMPGYNFDVLRNATTYSQYATSNVEMA
jgi:hypothetical protein